MVQNTNISILIDIDIFQSSVPKCLIKSKVNSIILLIYKMFYCGKYKAIEISNYEHLYTGL